MSERSCGELFGSAVSGALSCVNLTRTRMEKEKLRRLRPQDDPLVHTHSKAANRLWLGIQNTHGNDCGHRVSSVRKCSLKARLCVCAVCVRCVSVCVPERNSRWPLMAGVYAAKRRCTAV